MLSSRFKKSFIAFAALVLPIGCKDPVIKDSSVGAKRATGSKTDQVVDPKPTGISTGGGSNALAGQSILTATYAVNVKVIGMNLCQGTLTIDVHVPQSTATAAPESPFDVKCLNIKCSLIGTIQMDSLFGMLSKSAVDLQTQKNNGQSPLSIDEKFIRATQGPLGKYTPPMILLPNFTGADPAFLQAMNETQSMTATDDAKNVVSPGTQRIQTIGYGTTFSDVNYQGVTFDKVFHFTVANTGFQGIPRISAMMVDKFEAWINLAPLSLVKLHISTKAAEIMELSGNAASQSKATNSGECANVQKGSTILSGGVLSAGGTGLFSTLLGGTNGGLANGGLMKAAIKLIAGALSVEADAMLVDQEGLKDAYDRLKANANVGETIGLRDGDAKVGQPQPQEPLP